MFEDVRYGPGKLASAALMAEESTADDPTVWFGHTQSPEIPSQPITIIMGAGEGLQNGLEGVHEPSSYLASSPGRSNQDAAPDIMEGEKSEMWCAEAAEISPCQNPSPKCPRESPSSTGPSTDQESAGSKALLVAAV